MDTPEISNASPVKKIQKNKHIAADLDIESKRDLTEVKKIEKWVSLLKEMPEIRDIKTLSSLPPDINKILAEKIANQII